MLLQHVIGSAVLIIIISVAINATTIRGKSSKRCTYFPYTFSSNLQYFIIMLFIEMQINAFVTSKLLCYIIHRILKSAEGGSAT